MNNKTFVEKSAQRIAGNEQFTKRYGSLMYSNGVLYSYGTHYPLMRATRGVMRVNNRGYSNTTSKHIGIASRHATRSVHLKQSEYRTGYGYNGAQPTHENVKQSLQLQLDELNAELASCVRETSQKKTRILQEIADVETSIAILA